MIPKFRAWHEQGFMLGEENIVKLNLEDDILEYCVLNEDGVRSDRECYFDEVVLMQSTGLYDKNGVEIFEGDIVRKFSNINKFTDSFAKNIEPSFTTTLIVRDEGAFKVTYNGKPDSILNHNSMSMVKHMEVIGNIYENPELLDEVKE